MRSIRTERSLERVNHQRKDEDEVHARDRQQVREPAGAERAVVVGREIALTEHERARHRGHRGVEGRVDAASDLAPTAVDPGEEPGSSPRHVHVERAAGAHDAAKRLRRTRIATRRVPQALGRRERGHDVHLVTAGQLLGAAVDRRPARPRAGGTIAGRLEPPVPPDGAADPDGGRLDPRSGAAPGRQRDNRVRSRSLRLASIDAGPGPHEAHHDRQGNHPGRRGVRPARAKCERKDQHRAGRHFPGRDGREPAGGKANAGEDDPIDRRSGRVWLRHGGRGSPHGPAAEVVPRPQSARRAAFSRAGSGHGHAPRGP